MNACYLGGLENEEGLYVSYELTSLVIGTVGGGTSLPTQKECLQLMGCYGRVRVQSDFSLPACCFSFRFFIVCRCSNYFI